MNYYKLIDGETFVGIATQLDLRVYQEKHRILLACTEEKAQYIQSGEKLYHASWMVPIATDNYDYEDVDVIAVDEETYNILYAAVESGEEITVEEETQEVETETIVIPEEATTLEYVMSAKITEMSAYCNSAIVYGFDVVLSDGETHHFSLSTQDQLNLITLSSMIASGEEYVPYHADGEQCKYYSAADITTISTQATVYKTYHTSYYNSLKLYIESLSDIETISAVQYGMEIPAEYQSDVLQQLMAAISSVG